jgi:hypothetical protein
MTLIPARLICLNLRQFADPDALASGRLVKVTRLRFPIAAEASRHHGVTETRNIFSLHNSDLLSSKVSAQENRCEY